MQAFPSFATSLASASDDRPIRYSICTLVTRPDEYAECVQSFVDHGFSPQDCQYLYADNSQGNRFDGYTGVNAFLSTARGDFVILVHQDVVLLSDDRRRLDERLTELAALDPLWAVCGNAGTSPRGELAISISDPYREGQRTRNLPCDVSALDENFMIVRRRANIGATPKLSGFHFYGAELCVVAAFLGMKSYVIDFHLRHKSGGNTDAAYRALQKKWLAFRNRALRTRTVASTVARMVVSSSPAVSRIGGRLLESRWSGRIRLTRLIFRLTTRE